MIIILQGERERGREGERERGREGEREIQALINVFFRLLLF
jgi:hypothetical protein